jgi:hypothetical protein
MTTKFLIRLAQTVLWGSFGLVGGALAYVIIQTWMRHNTTGYIMVGLILLALAVYWAIAYLTGEHVRKYAQDLKDQRKLEQWIDDDSEPWDTQGDHEDET